MTFIGAYGLSYYTKEESDARWAKLAAERAAAGVKEQYEPGETIPYVGPDGQRLKIGDKLRRTDLSDQTDYIINSADWYGEGDTTFIMDWNVDSDHPDYEGFGMDDFGIKFCPIEALS
jgi:hypothetical protein